MINYITMGNLSVLRLLRSGRVRTASRIMTTDKPDSLSGALSKYLKSNGLIPSDKHTVYSLRHSFQDRLLAANAPDRVQADLMGHKFHRPYYGEGSSLKQKLEWLQKVQLKPEGP